jgi:ERCC4-related helicase
MTLSRIILVAVKVLNLVHGGVSRECVISMAASFHVSAITITSFSRLGHAVVHPKLVKVRRFMLESLEATPSAVIAVFVL